MLSPHLAEGTDKKQKIRQSDWPDCGPRFLPETSRTRSRSRRQLDCEFRFLNTSNINGNNIGKINLMLLMTFLCSNGDPLIGLLLMTRSNNYADDDNNNNKTISCRWKGAFSYKASHVYMIRMLHFIQPFT
jgi:hypothetical protein